MMRAGTIVRTNWTRRLTGVPTWALQEELARRGEGDDRDQVVRLPGLVVDPVSSLMEWRGETHTVGGRMMEVIHALALDRANGRRRALAGRIAPEIFRGFDVRGATDNFRTYITYIRIRFPGLILSTRVGLNAAYGLALDEAAS